MNDQWRLTERVVAAIERHLQPEARVSHNEHMPVLNSASGRTRQCDIVIRAGPLNRQTTTIVEVQDRQSKPEPHDLDGWLGKMREVGAQHLFCVATAGFPQSIVERAAGLGPTVRVMTLAEVDGGDWPAGIASGAHLVAFATLDESQGAIRYHFAGEQAPGGRLRNPNRSCITYQGQETPVSPAQLMAPAPAREAFLGGPLRDGESRFVWPFATKSSGRVTVACSSLDVRSYRSSPSGQVPGGRKFRGQTLDHWSSSTDLTEPPRVYRRPL